MTTFTGQALRALDDERTVLRLRIALRRRRGAAQLSVVAGAVRKFERFHRLLQLLAPVASIVAWKVVRSPRRRRRLGLLRFTPSLLRLVRAWRKRARPAPAAAGQTSSIHSASPSFL